MDSQPGPPWQAAVAQLEAAAASMQARAAVLDRDGQFPGDDVALLRSLGLLVAPLPRSVGGWGAGTERDGADALLAILRAIGRGNLALGRLYEAHVNALKLIVDYGAADQAEAAAQDARSGRLFGVWVTDPPGGGLSVRNGRLVGSKGPCSGAGHVAAAVVTVETPEGTRMAVLRLDGTEQVQPARGTLQGMRGSVNGWVAFDGIPLAADSLVGQPGDYLREPQLSTGAWRTSAVTLGGLDALVAEVGRQLRGKGHDGSPLQQERFGRLLIAQETAALWAASAARCAEAGTAPVADQVAYVNLARIAIEQCCLDALHLAQRSIGLGAFVVGTLLERLARDLSVYLRQPAPDAVLTEAAQHGLMGT